jgi:response regulator RpfG family c-di-GMP phosphodiesterase
MQQWLETHKVLVSLLENNRPDLRGHSSQVARLSRKFCERLGLADRDADEIVAAAYLHDLGKASSYHLTALNVSEYDGHKVAAEKSYLTPSRLMAGTKLPDATIRALNHMYERFDGKGFPDAMSGKEIPLGARVVAITDTYADLTQNPRNPYRKTLRPVEASDVLAKYKGGIFDNNLVDIFRHVVTGDDLKAKLLANRGLALIVDPDPEETTVLELRMIEQGFEVKIARTSDQALKTLQEGEFGLVISEVDLQPLDGFGLFERAQQIDGVRAATWVFLSSNTDRESIDKGFALGATDYVEKPVKAEILVAKLRKMMEQGSASRTAARGVSGSLEEMGFPELVQILAQGRKTGALKIRSAGEAGEIHFVGGDVYQATWGRARGEDAFYSMCKLRTGEFSLDPNFKAEQRAIQTSAEGMLLEGMRRMDEESRAG